MIKLLFFCSKQVSQSSNILFIILIVNLYTNNINREGLSYAMIVSAITHEIGHAQSLAHTLEERLL